MGDGGITVTVPAKSWLTRVMVTTMLCRYARSSGATSGKLPESTLVQILKHCTHV